MKTIILIVLIFLSTPAEVEAKSENFDYCVWAYNSNQDPEYLEKNCDSEWVENYILTIKKWAY